MLDRLMGALGWCRKSKHDRAMEQASSIIYTLAKANMGLRTNKDARMATKKPPARDDEIALLNNKLDDLRWRVNCLGDDVRHCHPKCYTSDTDPAFFAGLVIGGVLVFALFGAVLLCS